MQKQFNEPKVKPFKELRIGTPDRINRLAFTIKELLKPADRKFLRGKKAKLERLINQAKHTLSLVDKGLDKFNDLPPTKL